MTSGNEFKLLAGSALSFTTEYGASKLGSHAKLTLMRKPHHVINAKTWM
ncbi:MAG: hypothetical protein M0R33_14130 [Methylomonas sp.]|jgi:hypothetical protein|nr:hypothetical protein [Methylomonas sp.]MCK9607575.1 hypothetical protein [Methylomonas sp.]